MAIDGRAAAVAMAQVAQSIRVLSRVPSQVAKVAADKLEAVIRAQFDAEQDPYGKPWAPLSEETIRSKGGDTRILRDTDHMLDSLRIESLRGAGLSISLDAPYSAFHQVGTCTMPARPILPRASLPNTWRQALSDASDEAFDRWAEGAR